MAEEKNAPPAGHRWRLLAHAAAGPVTVEDEGVFDELTVDDWLHIEQMTERTWWMRIGDARVLVTVDSEGRASVDVERGTYAPVRGQSTVYREPEG